MKRAEKKRPIFPALLRVRSSSLTDESSPGTAKHAKSFFLATRARIRVASASAVALHHRSTRPEQRGQRAGPNAASRGRGRQSAWRTHLVENSHSPLLAIATGRPLAAVADAPTA
jgi:hypothetical protein